MIREIDGRLNHWDPEIPIIYIFTKCTSELIANRTEQNDLNVPLIHWLEDLIGYGIDSLTTRFESLYRFRITLKALCDD